MHKANQSNMTFATFTFLHWKEINTYLLLCLQSHFHIISFIGFSETHTHNKNNKFKIC
jgi:hypothetical protein